MGKADRRPWRESKEPEAWQRPPSSGKWDYWPGSWKASPKAKARFPSYDRQWSPEQITVVKEERFAGTGKEEESVAKPVQQAVNTLRKAEARVARICREQKEKATRWAAYQREVKAAFVEEEKRHGNAQERLAGELQEAHQQQAAAKQVLAQTMEAIFGSAMDVSRDSTGSQQPSSATWDRMFGSTGAVPPQAAVDPDLLELLRMYKNGQLPGLTGHPGKVHAETSGPMQAADGWPTGEDLPRGPVSHAYRAPSYPRPAPYLPSSPSLQKAALDTTNSAPPGHPVAESGISARPSPPTTSEPLGVHANPGPTEAVQASLGMVEEASHQPPMTEVRLPAKNDNPVSPLADMLRARRREVRHAMEPFGAPRKAEPTADLPPPDPGTGPGSAGHNLSGPWQVGVRGMDGCADFWAMWAHLFRFHVWAVLPSILILCREFFLCRFLPGEAGAKLDFRPFAVLSQWIARAISSFLPPLRFIVLVVLFQLLIRLRYQAIAQRQTAGMVVLAEVPGFQTLPISVCAVPAGLPLLIKHASGLVALLPEKLPNPTTEEDPARSHPDSRWVYPHIAEVTDASCTATDVPKHCILFQAGHSVRHFLAYLQPPLTKPALVQEALDHYPELQDHWVLHETLPQVADGAASFVAVPRWTQGADKTVFLLDFSACNGPVFAWLDWSYVNRPLLSDMLLDVSLWLDAPPTGLTEVQAKAADALSSELNDLVFGYPKPHSPLYDLVFRGVFVFVDPRAIGLNPAFLHVAAGDLHIGQVLGQIAQVSDECTLALSLVPTVCAAPAPLQVSAPPCPGHRDSASTGTERNAAHGARTTARIWPRAFGRDDPPPPDPETHLHLDVRDSEEEENDADREAFIDAGFLIFAPRFQPEHVRLVLHAPCDVDTALRALSDTRHSVTDLYFDCLLPAVPQPDTAFGSVLAVPHWDRRGSHVLVDSRQVDGRLFAMSFHGRLSRASFLAKAGFRQIHGLEVYLHGRALDHRDWHQFLAGDTVFVRQADVPLPPPVALADMLRDRYDWYYPCPRFEGPHPVAFFILTDEGSRVVAIDPDEVCATTAFKVEVERVFGYDRNNTSVCPIQPRLDDLAVLGQTCKSAVAVTQMKSRSSAPSGQVPPQLHVLFLDARLLLKDISWVTAFDGLIEVHAVLELFQRDAPFGFSVEATGFFRGRFFGWAHVPGSCFGKGRVFWVFVRQRAFSLNVRRHFSAKGATDGTSTGIWLAGLAAVHAASAVPVSSTTTLSLTALYVPFEQAAVEPSGGASRYTLRSFVPLLGGPWLPRLPYDLSHLLGPDLDDQEAQVAGIREEARRVQCLVLAFDFAPSVYPVDISLPATTEELVQALQPCRSVTHQAHLPSLLPVLPQPQPGFAAFVTAPHWHASGHGVCFDSTFIDNRIYVAFVPEYVDAQELVHIADLPRQAGIAVWIGPDLQLLPPGHRTHVFPGMLVLFLPEETEPPVLLSLGQLLLLRHVWGSDVVLPSPDFGPAYCLAGRGQGQLMLADLHSPTRYRRQISEATGANLHRMRIFASDPRPLDVALHGVPCRTVVAVGDRRRTIVPEVWHMAVFDCRLLECGWCAAYVVNGVLNVGSILDDFDAARFLRWRILLGKEESLLPTADPEQSESTEDPEASPLLQPTGACGAVESTEHRLPFFVLMPEYAPEVVVVQTSLPVTVEAACALVDEARDAHNQHKFSRLLPPQLQPPLDTPCLLAVPDWPFNGVPILIVSFVLPFRLFTVVVPPDICVEDILHLARIETQDVMVFVQDLPWASPLTERLHVQAGALFTVFPAGTPVVPPLPLSVMRRMALGAHCLRFGVNSQSGRPLRPAAADHLPPAGCALRFGLAPDFVGAPMGVRLRQTLDIIQAQGMIVMASASTKPDAGTGSTQRGVVELSRGILSSRNTPSLMAPLRYVLAVLVLSARCAVCILCLYLSMQCVAGTRSRSPDLSSAGGPIWSYGTIPCVGRTGRTVLIDYFEPQASGACQQCPAPPPTGMPVQVSLCERLSLTAHQASVLKLESLVPARTSLPGLDWLDTDLGPLLRDPLVPSHKRRLFEAVKLSDQVPVQTPCNRLLAFSDGSTGVATAATGNCAAGAWALSVWLETDFELNLVGHAAGTTRPPQDPYHLGERDDSPLTCELLGIAWGLIWIIEYASAYSLPVVCLYDCTAAGHGTFAVSRIPAEQQDPSAALASFTTYLRQLAAQRVSLTHAHVKGHSGQLGNELCDELAKHCRRRPPDSDQVILPEWPAASSSSDLPTLFAFESEALRMQSSPLPTLTDPGLGFVAPLSSSEPVPLCCTFMSYNVLSLYDPHYTGKGQGGQGMRVVAKRDIIKQQLKQMGVLSLGLQETRLSSSEVLPDKDFIMLHSSSDPQGHHGVALWVAKQVSYAVVADKPRFLQQEHLTVTGLSPRHITVQVTAPFLNWTVLVAHGPSGANTDVQAIAAFWARCRQDVAKRPRGSEVVVLTDANAWLGSVPSPSVSDHDSEPENVAGEVFHQFLAEMDLWAPSTFELCHQGPSPTWTAPSGHQHRLDYVAVPLGWPMDSLLSWVQVDFEALQVHPDHYPVALQLAAAIAAPTASWGTHIDVHYSTLVSSWQQADGASVTSYVEGDKELRRRRLLLGFAAFLHIVQRTSFPPQAVALYASWIKQARHVIAGASGRLRQVGLQLRAAVRQDRAQYLAGLVENISFSDIRDPKHLYRAVRRAFPSAASKRRRAFTPLPAVADKDGVLAADVNEQRALWREYFASLEAGELLPPGGYAQALMCQRAANSFQAPCFDLAVVPTLTSVEQSVLGLKHGKACGQDGLTAELLKVHSSGAARALLPVFVKGILGVQEPLEFRGGALMPLAKKASAAFDCTKFRAILLSCVPSKMLHKHIRTCLSAHLCPQDLQAGVLPGVSTEVISLAAKALLELFHRLRLPPASLSELRAHLESLATVSNSGCGEHLQRVATDVLQGTWFRLDKDAALTLTHCGTRPGDGLADLFFGFAFSAYLRAADEALLAAGLATPMPAPSGTEPWELSVPGTISCGSWADDFVHMHSQPAVAGLGRAIQKVTQVYVEQADSIGMELTFARDKTAALVATRFQEKDEVWPQHPTGMPSLLEVTSAISGITHGLPVVSAYCHLGGIVTATLTPAPDIGLRHALAANGVRSLGRRLFSAQKIPLPTRRALLRSLVLSKFVFGSSTIRFGAALHFRTWARHYVALWRALIPRTRDARQPHAYTVLRTAAAPSPPLALASARSVLLRQLATNGPHTLLRLLWVQWEADPAGSWLGSIAGDVSHASLYLPAARVLQASPCPLKALIEAVWDDPGWWTRQLKKATKLWLADLESWASQPAPVPEPAANQTAPPAESSDIGQFFPCEFCGALFPLRKHLTVHLARRHDVISPTRLLASGPTCVACLRHYHTVARLQNHLKRSGACLHRSACLFPPLTIDEVREVESQDKNKLRVCEDEFLFSLQNKFISCEIN
ncbi:unnamed protein product [Symbiodinium necroappetens]|uniref:C2H2-type domain-containing protein n=1 Tax=Symbiodinium necroappetens TaxID=1628268 RepID=A0A812KUR7_9DINO|nr:unnamed protein product [Symbiodinium necroappetens]